MTAAANSWKFFCNVEMHGLAALNDDFAEGKSHTVHGFAEAAPECALWSTPDRAQMRHERFNGGAIWL